MDMKAVLAVGLEAGDVCFDEHAGLSLGEGDGAADVFELGAVGRGEDADGFGDLAEGVVFAVWVAVAIIVCASTACGHKGEGQCGECCCKQSCHRVYLNLL